jgi:hypothetical protein
MSHLARGPVSAGIDSKANATSRRRADADGYSILEEAAA